MLYSSSERLHPLNNSAGTASRGTGAEYFTWLPITTPLANASLIIFSRVFVMLRAHVAHSQNSRMTIRPFPKIVTSGESIKLIQPLTNGDHFQIVVVLGSTVMFLHGLKGENRFPFKLHVFIVMTKRALLVSQKETLGKYTRARNTQILATKTDKYT